MTSPYDDPSALAALVEGLPGPVLLGLDVDGVLAPIVGHADDARLTTGIAERLADLAGHGELRVAVVSGRSLADLGRFAFPPGVIVMGSHGMEADGVPIELTPTEAWRLERLHELSGRAVATAGDGAWAESKPASVAVHVREADDEAGRLALDRLAEAIEHVEGATSIAGSAVLEVFARRASKGEALRTLRGDAATVVFVGDDVTDEHAFATLRPGDVAIKVGDADTIAAHRLRDPAAVQAFLDALSKPAG
jgi:trehalose 6-phosphate phosphatase